MRYISSVAVATISLACSVVSADDYAIVVSTATNADTQWNKVVTALAGKYPGATVLTWEKHVDEALPALRRNHPRHTCFVATPDESGRQFVIKSGNPKVYLPIGNCLMGHIDGPNAMALDRPSEEVS